MVPPTLIPATSQPALLPRITALQPGPRSGKTGAHLLKHSVTPEVAAAAVAAFGPDQLAAGRAILDLKQPRLRQVFQQVFAVTTGSGNNEWMKSKLLRAVGLRPGWHPPTDEPEEEEPPPGGLRVGRRQRRPPAALQQAALDSQGSGGSEQPARSRRGPQSSRSQASGAGSARKRTRGQDVTSAPPSAAPAPPMVVLVVADPQGRVPAWPGIMELPASLAAGGLPLEQAAGGGWQLPAGDVLLEHVKEAQLAQRQAWEQARQAQQQAQRQAWEQAWQARRQAQQQAQQQALQAASLAAPLAIEDVLLPVVPSEEVAEQQAAWETLRACGLLPPPATVQPATCAPQLVPTAPPPAVASRTVTTGATALGPQVHALPAQEAGQQQALAQGPVGQPAAQRAASLLSVDVSASRSAGAAAGRPGNPSASPFAAESALILPPGQLCASLSAPALAAPTSNPPPHQQPWEQLGGSEPWVAGAPPPLQPADFSLLGLSTLGLDGLCGASLALPSSTISNDLHLLFDAWEQGLVSLSLSRRNLLTAAAER